MISQPIATLGAASLAAFVALMTIIITKEQKVSEFRQAWINDLRDDLAEAISAASTLTIIIQRLTEGEVSHEMNREWARCAAALARIDLRLNLSEASHRELEVCIRTAEDLLQRLEGNRDDYYRPEWDALQVEVVAISQKLLKAEWERVKKGEFMYRLAKTSLLIVFIGTAFGGLATFIC